MRRRHPISQSGEMKFSREKTGPKKNKKIIA
jgi:hypothetical protein